MVSPSLDEWLSVSLHVPFQPKQAKMEAIEEEPKHHRDSALWLLSYPKSGNTWLRFITFYLKMGRMPTDSQEIDRMTGSWRAPGADVRPIVKSHAQPDALRDLIGEKDTAIYLHRHPLDVMQSALNYAFLNGEIDRSDPRARDRWIGDYVENRGNPIWFQPRFAAGCWTNHVKNWLAPQRIPMLTLSYDAAIQDPLGAVRAISDFLRLETGEQALRDCVAATSFASLKSFEEKEIERATILGRGQGRYTAGIRTAGLAAGHRFFSKGRKGSYRDALREDEIDAAWAVFRETAEPLGYRV